MELHTTRIGMDGRATSTTSEKSVCEKSMKLVANIIRVSSFSIALKTVGTTSGKTCRGLSSSVSEYADVIPEKEQLVPDQLHGSRTKSRANPTYVMTCPVLSNGSTSHVQEQKVHAKQNEGEGSDSVDVLATKFIEKMRKQLGYGSQKT